jgi:hypothetical protein
MVYERSLTCLMEDVLGIKANNTGKLSRDYTLRERGGLLRMAALVGVSEPQKGGRLHGHCSAYISVLDPPLLTRLAAATPQVQTEVASILDSMSRTHVHSSIREWRDNLSKDAAEKKPRAADIIVPDASTNYVEFLAASDKKAIIQSEHVHGFSCQKGVRGGHECRLCFPRGQHQGYTQPLMLERADSLPDDHTGPRPVVALPLNDTAKHSLDRTKN